MRADPAVDGPWSREASLAVDREIAAEQTRPALPSFNRTDAGNAQFFVHHYGDRIRYDHRRGRWLEFKDHRWQPDCEASIRKLAVLAARRRFEQSAGIADTAERKAEALHAIASESRQKVEAMLYFAQALPPVSDSGVDWDADPMLLGVDNGVVDLRAGALRPGQPPDKISMTTGVFYDPQAAAPLWDRAVRDWFEDKPDLLDWHQRVVGYSATGDTTEQAVIVKVGRGGEGKSVHDRAIAGALGDYALNVAFAMLELQGRAAIPSDLAELPGKRFVTASETNEGSRLNEARLKALSGGDVITARHLFQREFQFRPTLKLWLSVNHLPRVTDDSYGFWRRVRVLPFRRQFKGADADKDLGRKLQDEAPGILAWIVRGAVAWRTRGLDPLPEDVTVATRAYEDESDPLAEFRAARCEEDPVASMSASDLYREYQDWAQQVGIPERDRLKITGFGRRMGAKFVGQRTETGKVYQGVRVKP